MKPNNEILETCVKKAYLLLEYAIEDANIRIEKKLTEVIVKAYKRSIDKWTSEEEVEFWHAYQVIGLLVKPITAEIVANAKNPPEETIKNKFILFLKGKNREATVNRIALLHISFAILVFAFTIFMHGNWYVVGMILNEQKENSVKLTEKEEQLSLLQESQCENCNLRLEKVRSDISQIKQSQLDNTYFLRDWLRIISIVMINENAKKSVAKSELTQNDIYNIQKASHYGLLNTFMHFLPMFYGLLGSLVFILREMLGMTRVQLYISGTGFRHILRISMGTLAGVMIGLFLTGSLSSESMHTSLSPLTLAFLAGYNIDLLFEVMDRAINAFKNRKTNLEKES